MKIVAYTRVSTQSQGRSGLGLDAQRAAVDAYARQRGATVLEWFTEVESGKVNARVQLDQALHLTRITGATLVIAKLDRLSRDAAFLLALRNSGVRFIAADMPDANELTVGIMALVAQQEREAISRRTKEALQAAKRRGVVLGNPNGAAALHAQAKGANAASQRAVQALARARAEDLRPVVTALAAEGVTTLNGIAAVFNARGLLTPRGGRWHASSVRNLSVRLRGDSESHATSEPSNRHGRSSPATGGGLPQRTRSRRL